MRFLLLTALCALLGCVPITLSLNPKDGRAVVARAEGIFAVDLEKDEAASIVYRCPADQQGAFAAWRPDGKQVLFVTRDTKDHWIVRLRSLSERLPTELSSGPMPVSYASFSPTGSHVAVVLVPAFSLPSLRVYEVATAKLVKRLDKVSIAHAWDAKGEALYTLRVIGQDKPNRVYQGHVVRLPIAEKKGPTPLLRVATKRTFCLDYAPATDTLAIVALGASRALDKTVRPIDPDIRSDGNHTYLFLSRLKERTVQVAAKAHHPTVAVLSPDGRRVAINSGEVTERLIVVDTKQSKPPRALATRIAVRTSNLGDGAVIVPAWTRDGKSIVFWRYVSTMGLSGKSLRTQIVDIGTGKERDLEPIIERAVSQALK